MICHSKIGICKNKARGESPPFKNMTPNANNIYFFTGLRRLMPTPYRYVIPALWWLKGEEKLNQTTIL